MKQLNLFIKIKSANNDKKLPNVEIVILVLKQVG